MTILLPFTLEHLNDSPWQQNTCHVAVAIWTESTPTTTLAAVAAVAAAATTIIPAIADPTP